MMFFETLLRRGGSLLPTAASRMHAYPQRFVRKNAPRVPIHKLEPVSSRRIPSMVQSLAKSLSSAAAEPGTKGVCFQELCKTLEDISNTRGRKVSVGILTEFLKKNGSATTELKNVLKLCTGTIRHSSGKKAQKLMVSTAILSRVVKDMFVLEEKTWGEGMARFGDIGTFAANLAEKNGSVLRNSEESRLTCNEVVDAVDVLYDIKGKDSIERKRGAIADLLKRTQSPVELKFVLRVLQGQLRIGISNKSIMVAVESLQGDGPQSESIVGMIESDVLGSQVKSREVKFGIPLLKNRAIGIPIPPMLGRPASNVAEVASMLSGKVLCETKYDGERTQLHYDDHGLIMFSRNAERQNDKYPDLARDLAEHLSVRYSI